MIETSKDVILASYVHTHRYQVRGMILAPAGTWYLVYVCGAVDCVVCRSPQACHVAIKDVSTRFRFFPTVLVDASGIAIRTRVNALLFTNS